MTNKSKNLLAIFCALTILFSLCMSASAINVVVNGKKLTMAQPPIMYNGRVMVPVRDVFEALGVAVFYEPGNINCVTKDKTVNLTNDGRFNSLGDYNLIVNDYELEMDQQPINYNGKIMVPVRVISEALGASVTWDKLSETVTVTATIRDAVKLSSAEIDAVNAFTLAAARKKAIGNAIYTYFEDRFEVMNTYPLFRSGVKMQNILYTNEEGAVTLTITMDGEVSFETFYSESDGNDIFHDYQLTSYAKSLPFQKKYDGYLCGLAYVRSVEEGTNDFYNRYFLKAPDAVYELQGNIEAQRDMYLAELSKVPEEQREMYREMIAQQLPYNVWETFNQGIIELTKYVSREQINYMDIIDLAQELQDPTKDVENQDGIMAAFSKIGSVFSLLPNEVNRVIKSSLDREEIAFDKVETEFGKEYFFIFPKYEGTKITIREVTTDKNANILDGHVIYEGAGPVLLLANTNKDYPNTEVTVTLGGDSTTFCPIYANTMHFKEEIPWWFRVLDLTFYK